MDLNVASLNSRGQRNESKCVYLLAELSNLCVDVAAVQETHFTCEADCRVLEDDFVVYSAFGSHLSAGVSLLVGRSLDAIVNIVFAGDGGQLLVADVAVKIFEFRIAAVHAPCFATERCLIFWRLGSFLDASKRTVLVGDWNAILDPKIDRPVGVLACPMFPWFGRTDHELVRVNLQLANRPNLASYWKFNISLLEIWVFRKRLENRIQRALVGVVIGNKW